MRAGSSWLTSLNKHNLLLHAAIGVKHPDSAVRVRNDLLRWIMGFSSLTRMGWELTNNGRSPSVL